MNDQLPKLYTDLASWWPQLSAPADYAEEAACYRDALLAACQHPPATLLELGCGGGNNASHLKAHFELTLVDRSPQMLVVSRAINPECDHLEGDMRSVRLGRQFDAVFIHDAIAYLTNKEDLKAAIDTAFVHCAPGGAALFAPDCTRETFRPHTGHGGHDGDGRGLRYLEWVWDPDPDDNVYVVDFAYLLMDGNGGVEVVHDRHLNGLFSRQTWVDLISQAGFVPRVVPFEHNQIELGSCDVFLGVKSSAD